MPHKTIRRLEARGVPFGFHTRRHLLKLIRPIGVLHEVVCDGILAGDPNCMGLEVELENDRDIPDKLSLAMGGGRWVDIQIATMSHPPPQPTCPQSVPSSCPTVRLSSSPALLTQATYKLLALRPLAAQTLDCPQSQQLDQALPHDATLGETPHLQVQDISLATRTGRSRVSLSMISGPRDSLSVYRARRRYQSVLASPRDCSSWLTRPVEYQQATAREPTQADLINGLEPPGPRANTLLELLQIVEASTEGGGAPTPP